MVYIFLKCDIDWIVVQLSSFQKFSSNTFIVIQFNINESGNEMAPVFGGSSYHYANQT